MNNDKENYQFLKTALGRFFVFSPFLASLQMHLCEFCIFEVNHYALNWCMLHVLPLEMFHCHLKVLDPIDLGLV